MRERNYELNPESGIRNPECGMRNAESGMRDVPARRDEGVCMPNRDREGVDQPAKYLTTQIAESANPFPIRNTSAVCNA